MLSVSFDFIVLNVTRKLQFSNIKRPTSSLFSPRGFTYIFDLSILPVYFLIVFVPFIFMIKNSFSFFPYPFIFPETPYRSFVLHFLLLIYFPTSSIPILLTITEAKRWLIGRITFQRPLQGTPALVLHHQ